MIKLKALLFEQTQTETVNQKITRLYNEVKGTLAQLNSDIKATGEEQLNRKTRVSELQSSAQLSGEAGGKQLTMFWRQDVAGAGANKTGTNALSTWNNLKDMKNGVKNVSQFPLSCSWAIATTKLWTPQSVISKAGTITAALTNAGYPDAKKSLAIWNAWINQNAPKISELLNTIISAFPDGNVSWEEAPGAGPEASTRVVGGDKPVATAPTAAATTPAAPQG